MPLLPLHAPAGDALQLVATVTAASAPLASALAQAGATSFRLNASHMGPVELRQAVAEIRERVPDAPVVVDLQGAKMRLGELATRPVHVGQRLRFALQARGHDVPLPHSEVFASARVGDTLSCDDDRLRFRVEAATPQALETVSLREGPLRARKGVNVLEHPVALEDLTLGDQTRLDAVADLPGVAFAFSFMSDGAEADWVRRRGPGAIVVGKVEREEAVRSLPAIDRRVDATWICRGDLGAQLGMPAMARFVAGLDPRALTRPVVMAGQVLEHLTAHAEPTRSEVCHLWDLVARGYAGFVLSDETAIGEDPVRAVERAAGLLAGFRDAAEAAR